MSNSTHSSTDIVKTLKGTRKTGTTICGIVFDGGVVLAGDTRATADHMVMDKSIFKLHYLTPTIYCGGAGTATDNEHVAQLISSQLRLLELNMRRPSRVETAVVQIKRHLFPYQGHLGVYFVLGGCDYTGAHLYCIAAHGSVDKVNFAVEGSGSYAAMGVIESKYHEGMTEEEAVELAKEAITAGIINDEGSGFFVDYVVIRKIPEPPYGITEQHHHCLKPSPRQEKIPGLMTVKKGETEIMKEIVFDFATHHETVTINKPFNDKIEPVGDLQ
ncbi:putative Proteasome subunit beta type-7-B [Monocercomonoides exilis]|uniref:putative Proteasome subunit beta type-7-B n=1 Tax=Monocercomonoides exilis TaxID=2049356 RepID=UPI003559B838|nr:putative Proteasome subunit beta type-7-B [Monocercomonoides exilis]|eukprot:MONOS_8491.1-p1 / transcript=MONOS_8491.1 / gene=MONOS_8491 / organism=Monocercomonoides_exilis_PA203 / gene_product=Proteasome subunit beta type-7-B / transcript_product=Proteasome subunit beta type-7-B / location=Mono_scaffold00321:28253-29524(+) / protein_length=273 / sequence_SO=supercontig / SO=protein_coding / is_pseudo=false